MVSRVQEEVEALQKRIRAAMSILRNDLGEEVARALDAEATAFAVYLDAASHRAASEYAGGTLAPLSALMTIKALLIQRAAELEERAADDAMKRGR
jgi:uncharacterized protein YecT (DUF1311 family)